VKEEGKDRFVILDTKLLALVRVQRERRNQPHGSGGQRCTGKCPAMPPSGSRLAAFSIHSLRPHDLTRQRPDVFGVFV